MLTTTLFEQLESPVGNRTLHRLHLAPQAFGISRWQQRGWRLNCGCSHFLGFHNSLLLALQVKRIARPLVGISKQAEASRYGWGRIWVETISASFILLASYLVCCDPRHHAACCRRDGKFKSNRRDPDH